MVTFWTYAGESGTTLIHFVATGNILYFIATKVFNVVNNSICWLITPGHRTFIMPISVIFYLTG